MTRKRRNRKKRNSKKRQLEKTTSTVEELPSAGRNAVLPLRPPPSTPAHVLLSLPDLHLRALARRHCGLTRADGANLHFGHLRNTSRATEKHRTAREVVTKRVQ